MAESRISMIEMAYIIVPQLYINFKTEKLFLNILYKESIDQSNWLRF